MHRKNRHNFRRKAEAAAAICLGAFLLSPAAYAETIAIPAGTEQIEEEAFRDCTSAETVCVPEGVTQIGKNAFSGCTSLKEAVLPLSLEDIGEDAFSDCGECLLIECPPGSVAAARAAAGQFDYHADTVCRALAVGQTYTRTDYALIGPTYDMHAMAFCLRKMQKTDYTVTEKTNLTADGIKNAVAAAFAGAGENDISLFYYSGHGNIDGSLLGSDLQGLTPAELRACLDTIPGRKVVIVDACYSGTLIQDAAEEQTDSEPSMAVVGGETGNGTEAAAAENSNAAEAADSDSFTSSFLEAFSGGETQGRRLRARGALQNSSYFVMASCQASEESEEGYITSGGSGRYMGYFTYALCAGCGWDGVANRECESLADANADGVVSFAEAFGYASAWAEGRNAKQHAAVQPEGCLWFSPFRR